MNVLDFRDVSILIQRKSILRNLSFEIPKGQFVGLIGPNGSGKSTLLRTMSGWLPRAKGRISLFGQPLESYKRRDIARLVSFVPQDTVVDFDFSVRDIVMMGRHPYMSRFKEATREDLLAAKRAMSTTEISHLANRAVTSLSGGQRQMTFIAKALAQTPKLLLLDEPISALDIRHQLHTLELVRQLTSDGLTAVAALHDLNLAARYCDLLILLHQGQIHGVGLPKDVLTPSSILEVYEVHVELQQDPWLGSLSITTINTEEHFHNS
ncbi:ABC transporter ATP-binding protein [Paenibacillus lentus]|uniref:ABC transporter ATP-binding protein n=1 Tax=Paenibacillus lentus TaxID=1338368 RepID=UPI0013DDACC6|nr:ABC transporter ATP-binding protein [Paenibacillus lentus]